MSSSRILKLVNLTIVLGMAVCVAAVPPAEARPTAKAAATRTPAYKTKARKASQAPLRKAKAATPASTRKVTTQTAKGGVAKKGKTRRAVVSTSARKPTSRTSRTTAASTTSPNRKAGSRSKSHAPLTGRQRLARLHLEPDRVQEIQQALAREGYLHGDPSGRWDDQTRAAMLRYQTEHNFSPTGLPDAKSLMKLGLGPHPLPAELDPTVARAASPRPGSDPASRLGSPAASQEEMTLEQK